MERMKRCIPLVALALALLLGVGQPLQVFAASGFVNTSISDLPVSVRDYGGTTFYTYSYDVTNLNVCRQYTASGYPQYIYESSDTNVYYFVSNVAASSMQFSFGPCFTKRLTDSNDVDRLGFDYLDLFSVPDLVGVQVRFNFYVSCSPGLSGYYYPHFNLFEVDGTYVSTNQFDGYDNCVNFTQTKFASYTKVTLEHTLTDSELNALFSYQYVSPSITIRFNSCNLGNEFTICLDSIEFVVLSAEVTAAPPVLSQNWTASPIYCAKGSPASSLIVTSSFSSDEVGTVSYQWYKSATASTSGGVLISGATSSSYVPPSSDLGTSYYYCVVTNTYQDKVATATTSLACVKVVDAPKAPQITQNLSSGIIEYRQGDTASPFVISAINSGDGVLSYQWYRNTTNSASGGTAISGATKSSYTPSTSTVGTQYYYCVVTNSVGTLSESVTSNVAAVRVVPPPDPAQKPVINPNLSTSVKEYYIGDAAAELKIGASVTDGGTLTYQWYKNTVNSTSGGVLLPGETDRTFTPPTDTLGTMYYYCVVTNTLPESSSTAVSNVACIRVKELPSAALPVISTDLPKDPIVYTQGDAASAIGISARSPDGGVLSYQWYKNVVAENSGGTLIAGADGSSYEPATAEVGTAYYYVVVTNTLNGTTASVSSGIATVVVEQDMVPDLIGDVIDSITSLPQMLLDGIVGLFVPNAEAIAAYQDQWTDLLSSRFGAVYESVELLDEFAQAVQLQDQQNTVPFPSVTLNLAGTEFSFGGWTVQVVPDGFDGVVDMLKRIVSIIATLAFLNSMREKFERVLGGS